VQKRLNRSTCRFVCALCWVELKKHNFSRLRQVAPMCTSSIVFAGWRQCAPRHSTVSCAKTAEPIDLSFGLWTRMGRRKHKFNRIRQVSPVCPMAELNDLPFGLKFKSWSWSGVFSKVSITRLAVYAAYGTLTCLRHSRQRAAQSNAPVRYTVSTNLYATLTSINLCAKQ